MERPLRILAVDDEPSVTLSFRYVFAGPRYEVTCVGDGESALANLDANLHLHDMIIVDEAMPNLTGVELVSAIRQRGINGKIIVVSAHLTPEVRDEYDRLNVDQIFTKPFNVHELRSTVDALCR